VKTIDMLLRDAPLFSDLPEDMLELMAGCGTNVRYQAGESMFREGEPADTFFVLRQGRVALETHVPARGAATIETLDAGDVVGWSWLFPPYTWHFDARVLDPVAAVAFDAACLRDKCQADHSLGFQLMSRFAQVLIQRLQWTRIRLLDVYGDPYGS
jgi:CRP/FNR family transcriptional regulator, cyclic AMP receptor protein